MAMTMTMIGTPALVGLNTAPFQPANPMVVLMTNTSMATMATVARSGTEKDDCGACDDDEHDRCQGLQVVPGGIGESPVHDDVARQEIADIRVAGAGFVQK